MIQKSWGHYPERYMQVLEAARIAQLKVIALDDSTLPSLEARDEFMAQQIAPILHDKANKMIVFTGGLHAARKAQPKIMSDYYDIDSISFEFDRSVEHFYTDVVDDLKLRQLE